MDRASHCSEGSAQNDQHRFEIDELKKELEQAHSTCKTQAKMLFRHLVLGPLSVMKPSGLFRMITDPKDLCHQDWLQCKMYMSPDEMWSVFDEIYDHPDYAYWKAITRSVVEECIRQL